MRLYSTIIPYLLLVSFYSGTFTNFGLDKIKAINESPYHGVAVPLIGASDTSQYTEKDFENAVKQFKKESKKHIWPWVFFNRFIGYKEDDKAYSPQRKESYFGSIKGMDIYNEKGALEDFKNIWRISLRLAKETCSPGIVVDPETYNDHDNYNIAYLARRLGKSENDVKERLKHVGVELADLAVAEYPDATIWFLFTGLGNPVRNINPFKDQEYRTVTYVAQGMLERAKAINSKLKFVSGGELSLGYCYESFEDLKEAVKNRNILFSAVLKSFPNLYLGGTIAPWDKSEFKKEWLQKGKCGRSKLNGIESFEPLIKYLFQSYKFIWIYAAKYAGHDPYRPSVNSIYNKSIRKTISEE